MEVGCSTEAAQYLGKLPSRGYFSSTVPSSTLGGLRVYVCEHETVPPEGQEIKTDQTNILIRSLTLKKPNQHKGKQEAKGKGKHGAKDEHKDVENSKGKRPAGVPAEPAKKKKRKADAAKEAEASSRKDGAASSSPHKNYRGYTVDKLKSLLRERGLPVKGKKDELIARLKQFRGGQSQ